MFASLASVITRDPVLCTQNKVKGWCANRLEPEDDILLSNQRKLTSSQGRMWWWTQSCANPSLLYFPVIQGIYREFFRKLDQSD